MRVALYARFSSDLQRQTSIADQLRAARLRADTEGWPVVIERSDEGVSGATPFALRPGGKALLADALAQRFEVLIVEGLDRAFRDLGEQEMIVKRLEHRGLRIIGTSDGYDTQAKGRKVMRVARGLVNEIYLDDLREKTHRGLAGQFDRGLSAGGRSYGYRTEEAPGGRRMVIDASEADVVRWIFEQYADGHSVRAITHRLNDRGIASPRGGTWSVSALHGSTARGLGLLNNELYVGRVFWNRRQWLKDPETGKRRYVERPRAEWQIREQPELRIISAELWAAAHRRRAKGPAAGAGTGRGAAPRALFTGNLVCPACGGPMIAINHERYGCGVHKDRGSAVCSSSATFLRSAVDETLLSVLREELLQADAIADLQEETRALLATQASRSDAAATKQRLHALDAEVRRLADAIAQVGLSDALATRLRAAEAEQQQLRAALQAGATAASIVDDVVGRYKRLIANLGEVLGGEEDRQRTRAVLSDVIGPVRLVRDATGESYAEIEEPAERLLVAAVGGSLGLVARARNVVRRRLRVRAAG